MSRQFVRPELLGKPLRRLEAQQRAIRFLDETKALKVNQRDLHFDYGDGIHGNVWIDPHQIFRHDVIVTALCQDLLEALPSDLIKDKIEVVVGPERGGVKVGQRVTAIIGGVQRLDRPAVEFAEIHTADNSDELILPRTCAEIVNGKKVLLVDDVRNTGRTLSNSAQLLTEAGGDVVAIGVWYDRLNLRPEHDLGIDFYCVAEYEIENTAWTVDECPLCALKIPITKF